MNKFYKDNEKKFTTLIVIILILSIAFMAYRQSSMNDTLDVYSESDKVTIDDNSTEEEEEQIETTLYKDEEAGFSMQVPADWQQVTKSGYPTFVHSVSGSYLQFQVSDYDPSINNITSDSISQEVAGEGFTFVEYIRNNSSSYEVRYQDVDAVTSDYIEEVFWSKSNVVKVVCSFNDANYENILPYYEQTLSTFSWVDAETIPEDYYLYYSTGLEFEFGIPTDWTVSEADSSISAVNEDTTASETVSAIESTSNAGSLTATDVSGVISSGKSNFIMQSYNKLSDTSSVANYSYTSGDYVLYGRTYFFSDGRYVYLMTFDYQDGCLDEDVMESCASLYRSFYEPEEDPEDDTESTEKTAK